jgi:hypothetical protein
MVIWIYAKRIEQLENKMKNSTVSVHKKLLLYGPSRRNDSASLVSNFIWKW